MAEAPAEEVKPVDKKRKPKCSGCGSPFNDHKWGTPGPYCQGGEAYSSPQKHPANTADGSENTDPLDEEAELAAKLEALSLEEEDLQKHSRISHLRAALSQKQAAVDKLRAQSTQVYIQETVTPQNIKELRRAELEHAIHGETPLDNLLQAQETVMQPRSWREQCKQTSQACYSSEMFLKPRRIPTGEKVLKIVDFSDKIIPRDDEKTLSEVGSAKIVVSYGPSKPKLESITLQQWVVANTRIFYTLLQGGKLPEMADVQHYLAYTVKIMELSARFTWLSILKYDDEFRHLQAAYSYPWSFDSNHLHTVTLQPISLGQGGSPKSSIASKSLPNIANYTTDGRIICRNFNRSRCTLHSCNFTHVCNRKINGKACGLQHANTQHPTNQIAEAPPTTNRH